MINHYNILKVSRMSSNEEIKSKAKRLLKEVKTSKISTQDKNNLSKKIYESYQFLRDYHKRKSLDDYLDSQYKIISNTENQEEDLSSIFGFMNLTPLNFNLDGLSDKMKEMENEISNKKNGNTYFYSSSSTTTSNLDENGNLVSQTKEVINNNGKKDKKEYKTVTKKGNLKKKSLINF